jgi:hypothetical protein
MHLPKWLRNEANLSFCRIEWPFARHWKSELRWEWGLCRHGRWDCRGRSKCGLSLLFSTRRGLCIHSCSGQQPLSSESQTTVADHPMLFSRSSAPKETQPIFILFYYFFYLIHYQIFIFYTAFDVLVKSYWKSFKKSFKNLHQFGGSS